MGYVRPKRAKRPANRPKWPSNSFRRRVWATCFFEIHDPGAFDEHFFNGLLEAIAVLETHCAKRKYQQRAAQWFGVSVSPTGQVQFGITLDFPWEASDEMEQLTADMKPASKVRDALPRYSREVSRMKLGRNDPCHCGSGLKYKKCCLR